MWWLAKCEHQTANWVLKCLLGIIVETWTQCSGQLINCSALRYWIPTDKSQLEQINSICRIQGKDSLVFFELFASGIQFSTCSCRVVVSWITCFTCYSDGIKSDSILYPWCNSILNLSSGLSVDRFFDAGKSPARKLGVFRRHRYDLNCDCVVLRFSIVTALGRN